MNEATSEQGTNRRPALAIASCGDQVVTAPDGLRVHELLGFPGGSMALFELTAGTVGRAIVHEELDELWYVATGRGRLWRRDAVGERYDTVETGDCVSVPRGTCFQVKALLEHTFRAVAVTLPAWPGDYAARVVDGPWIPTVQETPINPSWGSL